MFYENFKKICELNNVSCSVALDDLGISRSKLTAWKNGSTPNSEWVIKISKHFNVSCDWLLTGKEFDTSRLDSFSEEYIARIFDNLNTLGKQAALEAISHLGKREEYKKNMELFKPLSADVDSDIEAYSTHSASNEMVKE